MTHCILQSQGNSYLFHLHDRYVLLHIFGVLFDTNNHAYGSLKSKDLALWNIVMSYRDGCFTVAVFFFFLSNLQKYLLLKEIQLVEVQNKVVIGAFR